MRVRSRSVRPEARAAGGSPGRVRLILLAVLALVALGLVLRGKTRTIAVGLNTPLRYDDFVFTVISAGKGERVGTDPGVPRGVVDYHVRLQFTNRAKRVNFQF